MNFLTIFHTIANHYSSL